MDNAAGLTGHQIQEFLGGSKAIDFTGQSRADRYQFIQQALVAQEYTTKTKQRGAVRASVSPFDSAVSAVSVKG
jgi:hypothetical protein